MKSQRLNLNSISEEQRLRIVTESIILGENTKVAQLKAARDKAALNLENTFIRDPVDGTPVQVTIRPGIRAAAIPLRPVMTFVAKEKRRIAGLFWQNSTTSDKRSYFYLGQ